LLYITGSAEQREIVYSNARYLALIAGRRYGKTATIRNRIILRTSVPNRQVWYVAPYYAQAEAEFEAFLFHPQFRKFIRRSKTQPFPKIWLRNGSTIGYRAFESNPQGLRSAGLDEVIVDEIQDISEDSFWPVVRPLISDKRGKLMIAGQFRGYNWYYKSFYLPGLSAAELTAMKADPALSAVPEYKSWRFPTWAGLRYNGEDDPEILSLRRQLPSAVFGQEIACVASANQAAAFVSEQIDRIMKGVPQPVAIPGKRYVIGLDLGRVRDFEAAVVVDNASGAVVHAEKFAHGMEHSAMAVKAGELAKRYNNAVVVMDSTGGATGGHQPKDSYVQFYRTQVKDLREFFWNQNNKEKVIQLLDLQIQQQKISIPPVFNGLEGELRAYEYKYKNGHYNYSAPDGQHDDYVSALAMALWGRNAGWAGSGNGVSLDVLSY
jgi:hypothetical protein